MRILYADVIVDISHEKLDRAFQYRVPEKLEGILKVGMRVWIPFGTGNKQIRGYCVGIGEKCKFDPARTKEIADIADEEMTEESTSVALAAWIRENYGSTMIQALKTVLPARQSVKKLEHRTVIRKAGKEELIAALGESQRKHQPAKARLLEALLDQESIPYEWITAKLNVSAQTISSLEKNGILRIETSQSYRDPVRISASAEKEKFLSDEQREIIRRITEDDAAGIHGTYLIHGVTGSGKTEVYLQLAEYMVQSGRQVILLIPEIALTYQTLLRFYRRFGSRVSVMNSMLSPGEKYDQCQRAKNGEIDVIIGPRSALFTPFPRLGLIIMDEEHEASYKSESTPKYHAREAAQKLAQMLGAALVLGSATPSVEAYYKAMTGEYTLFRLTKRLTGGTLPEVKIVDLRQELKEGNRSIFSRRLQELLEDRLRKKQQSILFLNRRGYAGFLSCRSCGFVMKCPHCDVAMAEHRGGRMICHYCGYTAPKPALCSECGSRYILGFKAGTQQIEEKLKELFPQVRTLRMDKDTTKTKDSYEKILSSFAAQEADVLIGTQMIVKGHDFPNVTLVGVLAADLSLGSGDYRAGERTFQLLTQAVGRAGRGTALGEAVIQTYQPEHYAVVREAQQDYEGFYQEEILYRELGGYPPAGHMLAVQIFTGMPERGQEIGELFTGMVKKSLPGRKLSILGPAPAGIGRINDVFRTVLYVKAAEYQTLIQVKDLLEQNFPDIPFHKDELVQFDFDPIQLL